MKMENERKKRRREKLVTQKCENLFIIYPIDPILTPTILTVLY